MSVEEIVNERLGEPSGILHFENTVDKQKAVDILIKNDYFVWDCTDAGPYAVEFKGY